MSAEHLTPSPAGPRRRLGQTSAFIGIASVLASFFIAAGAPTPLLPIYENAWHFPPWVLTAAFGVYALGLLLALLITGSLSDHIGRRPVIVGSVALELIAVLIFFAAGNVETLILARVVQGLATGAGTGALTAAIVELAPPNRKRLGGIIGSVSAAAGLAIGTLIAGFIAQVSDSPTLVTWGLFVIVMAAGLAIAIWMPETTAKTSGAFRSLIPRVAVPPKARRSFTATIPLLLAAWMMAALFMGLVPTIMAIVFDIHSPFADGTVAFLEPGAAAVTGLVVGSVAPRRTMILAGWAISIGAVVVILSIATAVFPLLCLGGIVGGIGFGASLSGSFRELSGLAEPHERAGLFAAIYLVAYLAFGIPAIAAGLLLESLGLGTVTIAFGGVIVIASAFGLSAQARLARPLVGRPGAQPRRGLGR